MELLQSNWPWYIAGSLIGLTVTILTFLGRRFGITSNLETICSIAGAGKVTDYFKKDWKKKTWGLFFIFGITIGGYIASNFMNANQSVNISDATINSLNALGINDILSSSHPASVFGWENLFSIQGILIFVLGGFLIGFGTRYAGGCTSGHAISGLSDFQLPSLVAVIGFFIGGIIMTQFILPIIFNL